MPYLGVIWLEFENYHHIWNHHPPIFLKAKFRAKMKLVKSVTKNALCSGIWNRYHWICLITNFGTKIKILKFGTKNALFGYFWAGIWTFCYYNRNQCHHICLSAKFLARKKMPKFGTKNVLFQCFWTTILKSYCHILNRYPQIRQKVSF